MPQPTAIRPRFLISAALLLALSAIAVGLSASAVAAQKTPKQVVKLAENETLGKTILTTRAGRTLYSLSVETNGKFTCVGSCLSVWHPLVVAPSVKPTGPVKLGTVKRPDGRTQVTFKGLPLYSFGADKKAGEVNGEGIKDVGTWHAAGRPKPAPPAAPTPPTEYPGGY
jgi:predicted lipoprotein with Yx(FWY)xxD motif